jgi:mono/diheme cytochrome c family protein
MKRFAVALAVALFLGATGGQALADAAATFNAKCAGCHGKDGKGQTTMGKKLKVSDLTEAKLQASLTDAKILQLIKEGAKDKDTGKARMPAFTGKLTDAEMGEQVQYVRHFRP